MISLEPIQMDLDRIGTHPTDQLSFDAANEKFATYQGKPGKGLGWLSWMCDGWSRGWVSPINGVLWYDDVVQPFGNWNFFLGQFTKGINVIDLGSGIDVLSFTVSAVDDELKEFYASFSFTPTTARVGVLPAGRWDWKWADLAPSEHSTAIQQTIFSTDKESA